ncbi:MAG: hydroxyacid dehydrogenase [Candidatus Margulisbacteria bacterium]|nr:hydroxyacid dehydrogenase [Candidatus Margulisiibacteriota bacterium]MBU1021525.1 hydroxyacid dehydrogenase [Candidatus Margulisiibacteriota bacterium]MBU1728610.1 hydroxyacid dehydrogenase [Candidatus Margulisiibacteriota bacterium]MBU1955811.1 hydroxyacid dehydrogenase [Candidatus Margulisiibacteriota bacterium]
MTKIYFNTNAFDHHHHEIDVTKDRQEAELLVMGAKTVEIEKFINLKAVYRFGVGANNVPVEYLREREISVYFPSEETKTILYDSTANFTAYLILYMNYCDSFGQIDGWKKFTRQYARNKNLLIIGTGNIGGRVVKKLGDFMQVSTFDIQKNQVSELKGLIGLADFISLHMPMTADNKNFIDREKLSWMKDDAVLVNTARGPLVDEEALHDRLTLTNMRAAFDVFWVEPYAGRLSKLPREKFFMTPHTASQTGDFVEAGFSEILKIAEGIHVSQPYKSGG